MGLKLRIQAGERLIVNGCIIKNGDRTTHIEVENRADVLRGNEILTAENCQTPVMRIQHQIQIALVSPDLREELVPDIMDRLREVREILTGDSGLRIADAEKSVSAGNFYAAYKQLVPVSDREQILLSVPLGPDTVQ